MSVVPVVTLQLYHTKLAAHGSGQQHAGTHIASSHHPFVIYGERLDLKTVIVLISVMKIKDAEVESYCNKNVWNAYCCCITEKQRIEPASRSGRLTR
jgi:hypothetical protein